MLHWWFTSYWIYNLICVVSKYCICILHLVLVRVPQPCKRKYLKILKNYIFSKRAGNSQVCAFVEFSLLDPDFDWWKFVDQLSVTWSLSDILKEPWFLPVCTLSQDPDKQTEVEKSIMKSIASINYFNFASYAATESRLSPALVSEMTMKIVIQKLKVNCVRWHTLQNG